jgi:hypothetical protein
MKFYTMKIELELGGWLLRQVLKNPRATKAHNRPKEKKIKFL